MSPVPLKLLLIFGVLGAGLLPVRGAEWAEEKLGRLVTDSDLIVVASTPVVCGFYLGEGPWPDGVHPTPEYREFIFPLTIARVLKGQGRADLSHPLTISYNALVYGPKDPPPAVERGSFHFKIDPNVISPPLEGAPRPNIAYVFFLQDRPKHEPRSHEAADGREIIYRNFDLRSGMIPARNDVVAKIEDLVRAG